MSSRTVPLHLASFGIISQSSSPLYVHSFTGPQDELRYHHLAHSALDVIEEREVNQARKGDNYLGLLFSMDDLAVYGYRTASRLRIVVCLGLIDGIIKDSDVVTICQTIHNLYNQSICNPFLYLNSSSTNEPGLSPIANTDLRNSRRMKQGAARLGKLLDGGKS